MAPLCVSGPLFLLAADRLNQFKPVKQHQPARVSISSLFICKQDRSWPAGFSRTLNGNNARRVTAEMGTKKNKSIGVAGGVRRAAGCPLSTAAPMKTNVQRGSPARRKSTTSVLLLLGFSPSRTCRNQPTARKSRTGLLSLVG